VLQAVDSTTAVQNADKAEWNPGFGGSWAGANAGASGFGGMSNAFAQVSSVNSVATCSSSADSLNRQHQSGPILYQGLPVNSIRVAPAASSRCMPAP